jgi:hypothetical protein
MNRIQRLLVVPLLWLLAGCGLNSVAGSGQVITESRKVSDFQSVALDGNGELTIEQTGKESLTITADDNLLPLLTSDVNGTQLVLGTQARTSVSPSKPIVYKLEVGKLVEIAVTGNAVIVANGIVSDQLKIEASGSTKMTLSGQAERQEISIAGSGDYQASELKSKDVRITITGSGNAVIAASEKLDVNITGSGSIEYIGDPVVTKSITGSGDVKKR